MRLIKMVLFCFFPLTFVWATGDSSLILAVKKAEKQLDARMGIAVYDLETMRHWEYRGNERFPLTSTFKTFACGALLWRVDGQKESLERVVEFGESALVEYSPITQKFAGKEGMSLFDLCEATLLTSDNSAANFILKEIGGPEAVTSFLRLLGDGSTRLDRWETDLNEGTPGDARDTTTPLAMAESFRKLLLEDVLLVESRQQLKQWLVDNQVSAALLRKSVPKDWVVADRTGAGGYGSRSITALMWPPERKPVVVALYLTQTSASFEARNQAIAEIGTSIVQAVFEKE